MTHPFIHSCLLTITLAVLTCLAALRQPLFAAPLGSAVTSRGRLNDGAGPVNGRHDLRFAIYDGANGGSPVVPGVTNAANPGFVLQVSPTLTPPAWAWTNALSGATNAVIVPATLPARFYRLFRP